jgi:hypothetical protein
MTLLASYAILGTLLVFIITKAVDNVPHVVKRYRMVGKSTMAVSKTVGT